MVSFSVVHLATLALSIWRGWWTNYIYQQFLMFLTPRPPTLPFDMTVIEFIITLCIILKLSAHLHQIEGNIIMCIIIIIPIL